MKKLLLILVAILSVIVVSACETREISEEPSGLNTYDYSLMVVVSRQRLSQDTFVYVLREAETTDIIIYEINKLWSVGEFIIAIELDEEGNVYYTDLNTTIDMIIDITEGRD